MRMKKLLTFLVLLTVSVGSWAAATATKIADSGTNTPNGKGFTYDHTAYSITVETAGELATELNGGATISDSNNPSNKLGMNYGTYFVFNGPLNADDLAALSQFGDNNDVYFDFSNATFVDNEGNPLTDTSLLSNLSNTKVKYLVLPNNITEVEKSDFPANVLEAIAVNPTTKSFIGYSSPNGVGTLENILNFDLRACAENFGIENFTLVGTYTYNPNSTFKTTYSTSPFKESVFGFLAGDFNRTGFTKATIKNLDLSDASFPNYDFTTTETITVNSRPVSVECPHNAMELITEFNATLESVVFPTDANTTLIPYHTFYNCKKVTSFDIPGNFKRIGLSAFEHCEGATTITFSEGLTDMDPDAFYCCYELTEVDLPVGLQYVGEYAFTNCSKLKNIVIPEGVTRLKAGCFEYTNIEAVRLPNSLEYIDDNAFRQCLSLKTVTIPANVKKVGSKAFYGSHSLTDVYVLGTTTIPECAADAFDGDAYRHHNNVDTEGMVYSNLTQPYGYEGYADILDLTTVEHSPEVWEEAFYRYRPYITAERWGYGTEKGAAILHYPQVSQEAKYSATAATSQEISDYLDAQDVDDTQVMYYIEDGKYKRVFFTPHAEDTYYSVADDAWTETTTSVPGVSSYYNSEGYYVTPFIKCGDYGNAPQYYEQDGTKPTYNSQAIHQPQTVDGTLVTTYYTKNGETYTESPLKFSQTKYHSPVTSTVDNYVQTNSYTIGKTYYANDQDTEPTNSVTFASWQSVYYISGTTGESKPKYTRIYTLDENVSVFYDANGNEQSQVWLNENYQYSSDNGLNKNYTGYEYKGNNVLYYSSDGTTQLSLSEVYLSTNNQYYKEDGTEPVYIYTRAYGKIVSPVTNEEAYFNSDGSPLNFTINLVPSLWYKDGTTKQVTTYTAANEWDSTISTYYKETYSGSGVYEQITSWQDNDFQGDYYYQTGTVPNYVSVCGTEYKPSHVYYTDNTGTNVATEVNLDGTYYTLDESKMSPVSQDVINKIILKQTKTYAYKDANDEYHIVDAAYVAERPNETYYEVTQTASDDVYGEYYTVPERNARYGGILAEGADDHGLTNWPDQNDLRVYPGGIGEDGVHFDLINGKDYSGWKNFLLAGGYSVEKPDIVVPIENVKKDVWYTFCVPFNLTDAQLQSTFGSKYELAEFAGVSVDDAKETYTLNFTTDVKAVVKHRPYMIHPYSKAENADGTPAETSFTITGVDLTDEDLNAAPSDMIKVLKDGFTFVAYGHNYDNNSEVSGASPVVIPQWAFYLAQDPSLTYPKFYRQTGNNSRTTGGRWTKNTAVVLPPTYEWSYTDSRSIYAADGSVLYGGDTGSAYYNYLCEEYKLEKEVPATGDTGVKSMFINFTNEPINHDADAIDIIEKTDAEQTIPVEYMNKIFNLSGQMVGNSTDGLEKGIYIKNGKKFIVR